MDGSSVTDGTIGDVVAYEHGIRPNIGQFAQQLLQVFFVGLTIGMQRNVVPALAESEFGVPAGSFTLLMAFVVSFGFVKGAMNFVSGRLSEKVGRRKVLIAGWLVALPIPFIFLYAPSWGWIVAANVLLGINQGFVWSMTVTSKLDIVRPEQRGVATGFNEFAGYGGVALAGLITGYLASIGRAPSRRRTRQALTRGRHRDFRKMSPSIRRRKKSSRSSRSGTGPSPPCRWRVASRSSSMRWSGDSFRCICMPGA
jgi:hypothetical protein